MMEASEGPARGRRAPQTGARPRPRGAGPGGPLATLAAGLVLPPPPPPIHCVVRRWQPEIVPMTCQDEACSLSMHLPLQFQDCGWQVARTPELRTAPGTQAPPAQSAHS